MFYQLLAVASSYLEPGIYRLVYMAMVLVVQVYPPVFSQMACSLEFIHVGADLFQQIVKLFGVHPFLISCVVQCHHSIFMVCHGHVIQRLMVWLMHMHVHARGVGVCFHLTSNQSLIIYSTRYQIINFFSTD